MASQTEIINWAITKIGSQRVLSIDDDTPAGRTMKALYTQVRDAELRRYRWRFAITRAELVADATAPLWGYELQYQLPPEYLALVQCGEFYVRPFTKDRGPWTIEGRKLLTDLEAPLRVRYVQRVTDTSQFDPLFVEMLACKMAVEGTPALKQNEQKLQGLKESYVQAMNDAARADSLEIPPDEIPWGTWLESREGNFGSLTGNEQIDFPSGFSVV